MLEVAPVNLNAHVVVGSAMGRVTKAVPSSCTGPVGLIPDGGLFADMHAEIIDEKGLKIRGKLYKS
jgi:hypothetical protein